MVKSADSLVKHNKADIQSEECENELEEDQGQMNTRKVNHLANIRLDRMIIQEEAEIESIKIKQRVYENYNKLLDDVFDKKSKKKMTQEKYKKLTTLALMKNSLK